MAGYCSFGGVIINNSNRFVDASDSFIVPERDVEFVEVPGKDGSISFDNGRFKNITIPVTVFIRIRFLDQYRSLANALYALKGYQKLRLPYRTDAYRLAVFHSSYTFDTGVWNDSGKATLNFNCKPFWYMDDGDVFVDCPQDTETSMTNLKAYPSKPLIRLYGNGSVYLGSQLIVSATNINTSSYPYVDIDCEAMTISYNSTNLANYVSVYSSDGSGRGFPTIPAFSRDKIRVTSNDGNAVSAKIKPRWVDL